MASRSKNNKENNSINREEYFNNRDYRRNMMKKKKKSSSRWTKIFVLLFLMFIGGSVLFGAYLFQGLPPLSALENPKQDIATRIYSEDGELLDQFFIQNRTIVT